jgi:hypothetical protein
MVAPAKCSQAACVFRRGRVSTRSPRRSTNPAFSNGRGARRRPRHHHRPRQPRRRQDARRRSVFRPVPFGELRSGFSVSFFAAAGLVHPLREARERLLKLRAPLAAVKPRIIDELVSDELVDDELGYVPLLSSSKGRRKIALRDRQPTSPKRRSSRPIFHSTNGRASSAINV